MTEASSIFLIATSNKAGSLTHPTARAFDPSKWTEALATVGDPNDRDLSLTLSALWFGQQISILRRHTDSILEMLGRDDAVMLAVAQLNREYATLQRRMARARHEERKQDYVDLQYAGQRPLRTGVVGNEVPADDINDALVDTLPVWLHQAFQRPELETRKGVDYTDVGVHALRGYTLERTYSKLWQQCLWLDWRLSKRGGELLLAPHDAGAEILRHAWLFRQQSLANQNSFIDLAIEQGAKKANLKGRRPVNTTIIAQEARPGKRNDFILGRGTDRSSSHLQGHMWTSVENSYVGMFLDTPLPKVGLSCSQLQLVWYVLADACGVLHRKCRQRRQVDAATLRDWALSCSRAKLLRAVVTCCKFTPQQAEQAIKFLTYDGSDFRRGVWSMPLIVLSEHDLVLMCHSPLEIGNPVRRVEQWLERGGLSDQLSGAKRGSSYETWVRSEIASCLAKNSILADVASIANPIKPEDRSIGDIDAAFRIKDLIVVVEVKCLLTPAEPIEQHRYRNKLEDAASQAARKAEWLAENIEYHRSEFGLTGTEAVEVKPLVLTNQGYGLSLKFDDCLVCDFQTLSNYLGDNSIVIGGAFSGITGKVGYTEETLYRSEDEARRGLLPRIREAPTLKRYIDRTKSGENIIPCHNPPSNALVVRGLRLSSALDGPAKELALKLAQHTRN
ncbi:hypothetical protein [Agrobacterium tumefaciens]|uniref:hypothetical protein n=1 Tax=Agrobacterium tumefaciens TaxID=358 RepID=UPI000F9AE725|nr:hypothetical protein [Agrobacterium tumefaciens]NSX89517.1 hypothetical protein [Agrobacterium tumefaciens]